MSNNEMVPVLSISTNSTGSHRTLYPVGTKADALVHDYEEGLPTYAEGVDVEFVTPAQAKQVREAGNAGVHFSDTNAFYAWLAGE